MAFKINIADKEKGLTYHLDSGGEAIIGLKMGDVVKGEDIDSKLSGYEFEIKGMSDKAGFPSLQKVEGTILKRVLLKYGTGMKDKRKGLRKRKTVRGNTISADSVQINLFVKKKGEKSLSEIFPEQCKPEEKAKPKPEEKKEEKAAE